MALETDFDYYLLMVQICHQLFMCFSIYLTIENFSASTENYQRVFLIVFSLLVVFLLCFFLKKWNERRDLENGAKRLKRGKRDFKIGFGGIAFIGILSQIAVVVFNRSFQMMVYTYYMCTGSCIIFYVCFIRPHVDYCFLTHKYYGRVFNYVILFHVIHIIVSFWWITNDDPEGIAVLQFTLAMLSSGCISDFWVIWMDGVALREVGYGGSKIDTLGESESDGEEDILEVQELECKICTLQFNGNSRRRTPRLLRCGHTICHECVKKLLQEIGTLHCPMCRRMSDVYGRDVSLLRKNWLVIELIEEMKRAKNFT